MHGKICVKKRKLVSAGIKKEFLVTSEKSAVRNSFFV